MSVYLDASVLVAFFTTDSLSGRADAFMRQCVEPLVVSDFAAGEFASAIARETRIGEIRVEDARQGFVTFDAWMAVVPERAATQAADIDLAGAFIRALDLPLRTPDAINIAIAHRVGGSLAAFDPQMKACARSLGLDVATA